MNKRVITFALGLFAVSYSIAGEQRIQLSTIEGAYRQSSTIFLHPGPEVVEESSVSNLLCIRRLTRTKVQFYLKTWGDDAHYCGGKGIAEIERDSRGSYLHMAPWIQHVTADDSVNEKLLAVFFDRKSEEPPVEDKYRCELKIRLSSREFVVEPVSGECNSRFMCGTKAGIATSFSRKHRDAIANAGECFEE